MCLFSLSPLFTGQLPLPSLQDPSLVLRLITFTLGIIGYSFTGLIPVNSDKGSHSITWLCPTTGLLYFGTFSCYLALCSARRAQYPFLI